MDPERPVAIFVRGVSFVLRGIFAFLPGLFLLTSCAESLPELPESLPEEKAALITAVLDPKQKDISRAIAQAGNPNFIDERGVTPLEYAVISSDTGKIKALLRSGADPLFTDVHGFTAVHTAAANPDAESLECLLNQGVPPDVIGPEGKTPLMEALRLGNMNSVRILLAKKADLKKADEHGRVPLCFAAMARVHSLELVKLLDTDFVGRPDVLAAAKAAPKMGNADPRADGIAKRVIDFWGHAFDGKRNGRGGVFRPGTGSAMYYIWHTRDVPASAQPTSAAARYRCAARADPSHCSSCH